MIFKKVDHQQGDNLPDKVRTSLPPPFPPRALLLSQAGSPSVPGPPPRPRTLRGAPSDALIGRRAGPGQSPAGKADSVQTCNAIDFKLFSLAL